MLGDFVDKVTGDAMQSVAMVTEAAGLGDSVHRLDQPMQRLVVERLAARIAAGAEAEIFDRQWVVFLAPDKAPGAPDRRAQVLRLLDDWVAATKADLPSRPDPMAALCKAVFDVSAYGPAIDAITEKTVQAILKALKGGRKGGFRDCQGLRYAVKDHAVSLFLEMDQPDIDGLGIYMRVSVNKWILRVMQRDIL